MQAALARALIGTGRTPERACGTLGRSPGHGPGVLQDDSRANFSVGNSCHVVGSERNMFAVWDDLAGNEVRWFLAKVSGPKLAGHVRGRGQSERPMQVMMYRFGVAPPPALQVI